MSEPAIERAGEAMPVAAEGVGWDAAADQAIAACDGDLRATVKALLVLVDTMERDADLMRASVSRGFARGWFHRQEKTDADVTRPEAIQR